MDVRGAAGGAWELIKLGAFAVVVLAAAVFGVRLVLSNIGQEQPVPMVANARVQMTVFPTGTICYGEGIDGFGPPCATVQYTSGLPSYQVGPEWCVSIAYLYQRQSDVDAVLAEDPVFPFAETMAVPYYHATLEGRYCGAFRTFSFNGRNNENDVNGWVWGGPVNEIRDEIQRKVEES